MEGVCQANSFVSWWWVSKLSPAQLHFTTCSSYPPPSTWWSTLVNSRAVQLFSSFCTHTGLIQELCQWALDSHVKQLDPINQTCFSYMLMRICLLNLRFYAHAYSTSSRVASRCIKTDKLLFHYTMTAHFPGECIVKTVN